MLALGGRREHTAHRPAIEPPPLRSGWCPGHTASPSSPPAPGQEDAVCCMCGDHGLPEQLFRCKSCRVRTQHSYCSELYPRATAYRRCNWCLREPPAQQGGAGAAGHAAAVVAANGNSSSNNNNKPAAAEAKRKAATTATASDEDRHQQRRHEGCSRRQPAVLGHPVKKKRVSKADDGERAPPGEARVKPGSCDTNAGGEKNRELMRAGKPRVKVRRYKLLAEVISC